MSSGITNKLTKINNLTINKQILLIGILSILSIGIVFYNLYKYLSHDFKEYTTEIKGLNSFEVSIKTLQQLQNIRKTINNKETSPATSQELIKKTEKTIQSLQTTLINQESLKKFLEKWHTLNLEENLNSITTRTVEIDSLIQELLIFMLLTGDQHGLSTDKFLNSHYIISLVSKSLPFLIENIEKLNILITNNKSNSNITHALALRELIETQLVEFDQQIERNIYFNPDLSALLISTQKSVHHLANASSGFFKKTVVPNTFSDHIHQIYSISNTEELLIKEIYSEIFSNYLPELRKLINDRLLALQTTFKLVIGIPLGSFLFLGILAVSTHRRINHSLVYLTNTTRAFAENGIIPKLPITSDDEFSIIFQKFNEITAAFTNLLQTSQNDHIRLLSIIDTAMDAVVQMNSEGLLLAWNKQAENIFGWQREEVIGKYLYELITPNQYHESTFQILNDAFSKKLFLTPKQSVEMTAIHKTGKEFPIEITISCMELNGVLEFNAFIRDITEQKCAIQTLATSEKSYRNLFESTREAILIFYPDGTFLSCNKACLDLFNFQSERDFLQQSIISLSPEYQNNGALSATLAPFILKEAIDSGFAAFEWNHITSDKNLFFADVHLSRIEQGDNLFLLASIRDNSERKRAKLALEASEAQISAILRTMSDAVILINTFGLIEMVNQSACEMYGYMEYELIGKNINILIPEPYHSQHDSYLKNYRESRISVLLGRRVELTSVTKSGKLLPIELSVNELVDDTNHMFIGVIRDIAERKQAEEERTSAIEKITELANAKSEFLANMSHEIRTPLNAIIGFAKIGAKEQSDPIYKSHFSRIHHAGKHLLNIVNDILDFSKLEAGKIPLDMHPFQINALINDSVQLIEEQAKDKNIPLIIHSADNLPEWLTGDSLRIRQILVNLLTNAIKFTQRGHIETSIDWSENQLKITITDTGIGISAEHLPRLFNAFEQADGSTTRKYGGSGLGLSISRNLARLMEGDLTVTSALGIGSQFLLTIPALIATPPPMRSTNSQKTSARLDGLKIFAAEDIEFNRMVLESYLVQDGAQVIFAENGRQALERLSEIGYSEFDIVLMDIQMPEMDGYQATQQILRNAPDLPILGLTAHAMAEDRKRCLDAGMRACVVKPIDQELLVQAILDNLAVENSVKIELVSSEEVDENSIDWPLILQQFDDGENFILKLIEQALYSQPNNIIRLDRALTEKDFSTIQSIAHSLKGIAGLFRAKALLLILESTEVAAKKESDDCFVLAKQVVVCLENLLDKLRQYKDKRNIG